MVSTIVQPVPDMARKAVELLLKKIKGEEIETLTIQVSPLRRLRISV